MPLPAEENTILLPPRLACKECLSLLSARGTAGNGKVFLCSQDTSDFWPQGSSPEAHHFFLVSEEVGRSVLPRPWVWASFSTKNSGMGPCLRAHGRNLLSAEIHRAGCMGAWHSKDECVHLQADEFREGGTGSYSLLQPQWLAQFLAYIRHWGKNVFVWQEHGERLVSSLPDLK